MFSWIGCCRSLHVDTMNEIGRVDTRHIVATLPIKASSSACSPKTICTALQGRCLPCSPGLSYTRTLVLAHICIVASHSSWCLLPTFVPMFSDSQKLRPFWHNSHISLVYHPVNRAKKQLRHPILHRIVVDIGAVNNGNNL